jgi:hypothetical protein
MLAPRSGSNGSEHLILYSYRSVLCSEPENAVLRPVAYGRDRRRFRAEVKSGRRTGAEPRASVAEHGEHPPFDRSEGGGRLKMQRTVLLPALLPFASCLSLIGNNISVPDVISGLSQCGQNKELLRDPLGRGALCQLVIQVWGHLNAKGR